MRISKIDELSSLVICNVKDGIGVTLYDTFFVDSSISLIVLRTASAHQCLHLVQPSKTILEKLEITLERLES